MRLWTFCAGALVLVAGPAFAGFETHGGELAGDQENIWFLDADPGAHPIEFCVERSADYPVDASGLIQLIQQSSAKWRDFFAKYGLDGSVEGVRMVTTLRPVAACTRPYAQIKFLFGVTNDVVDRYGPEQQNALGAAIREPYDHAFHRTGGVVWIKHFSPDVVAIEHLLLHELGHVFGMKHDSVFVMDANVAHTLMAPPLFVTLGEIETPSWPFNLTAAQPDADLSFTGTGCGGPLVGGRIQVTGLMPNLDPWVPAEVRRQLGLSEGDCHSFRLHFETGLYEGDRVDLYSSVSVIHLLIRDTSGKSFDFTGDFGPLPRYVSSQPPGALTLWPDLAVRGRFEWRSFNHNPPLFPAHGKITIQGVTYPATLDQKRGIELQIFLPGSGTWWTISG